MKRCIKGGFLVLGGVVGVVGMIIACLLYTSTGIVISISFQKVYDTPHAKACADCDYKSF